MKAINKKIRWKRGTWLTYWSILRLANAKETEGHLDEADELINSAINYFQSTKDSLNLYKAKYLLAINLWDFEKYEKSISLLLEIQKYAQSKNDINMLLNINTYLGNNNISKKKYQEALFYFNKAFNLRNKLFASAPFSKIDSLVKLAELKTNLVEALLLTNQKQKAEKLIPWVENTYILVGSDFEKYYSNSLFTFSYIEIGDFKKAEKYGLKCAYYAKLQPSLAHEFMINTYFSKIYKGLGKYKLAIKYLEELRKVEAALAFDKMNAKVTELQLKYDTEAKQKRISELTLEKQKQIEKSLFVGLLFLIGLVGYVFYNNQQLRRKNREITEAMLQGQTTERRRVAIDLHDNLGSTLSSIGWSMDAIDKSKMSKKELEVYQNLQKMISTAYSEVRLLSHNLLPEELEKQGLITDIQTLVRKLNQNTKTAFELVIPDDFERLNKKTEFELYSICLELVNNILKHSQAKEATILFEKENKQLKLSILDNGKGMFENKSDGKGLKNVQARVDSLGGRWNILNTDGKGIANEIIIKL